MRPLALALALLLSACAVIRLPLGTSEAHREVSLLGEGTGKVLLVEVSGTLSFRSPWSPPGLGRGESLPARVRADLDRGRKDPQVKALLVKIDSSGGTVAASDVVLHEILSFREEKGVPVVAVILERGLSGGYYVALGADEILALPAALVGSVGVFVAKLDASILLERWGVRSEITKAGAQKDLLSPLRPLGPEEQETLREIVDAFQDRFVEALRAARPGVRDADLEVIATGAPFTAQRAQELGMIDRVGYLDDAFRAALERAGLEDGRLVAYRRGSAARGNPYALGTLLGGIEAGPILLDPSAVEELFQAELRY
ncbi:MAG: S49 family peptidase [Deferrisomatales bacterium]